MSWKYRFECRFENVSGPAIRTIIAEIAGQEAKVTDSNGKYLRAGHYFRPQPSAARFGVHFVWRHMGVPYTLELLAAFPEKGASGSASGKFSFLYVSGNVLDLRVSCDARRS